jgi:hypothetical protein
MAILLLVTDVTLFLHTTLNSGDHLQALQWLKAVAEIFVDVLELLLMFSLQHDSQSNIPQVIIREADFFTGSKIAMAILLLVADVTLFSHTTLNGRDHLQVLQWLKAAAEIFVNAIGPVHGVMCMCFLLVLIVLGISRRCEAKARGNQRCHRVDHRRNMPVKRRPKSSRPRKFGQPECPQSRYILSAGRIKSDQLPRLPHSWKPALKTIV